MNKLLIALCLSLGLTLSTGAAFAKEENKEATPQQSKMANCNKEAKEKALTGADRKAFMKSCLSNKPAATPATPAVPATSAAPATPAVPATPAAAAKPKKDLTPQQQRMKNCNKEAKEKALSGADRKAFMSGCLKADAKPAEAKK